MATITVILAIMCLSLVCCCNRASECLSYECCQTVKWPQAVGKRSDQGECRPMGTQGQSCWVHPGTDGHRPTGVVAECPCETGLHCVGIGEFVVPYGEVGNCAL